MTIVAYELVAALGSEDSAAPGGPRRQGARVRKILMTGRTELQDALPIRMGQVFGAWAGCAERDRWRFHKLKERLRTTALGGTAIGTCFSASPAYMHAAERRLRAITGLPLSRSQNLPDEIAHQDKLAEAAAGDRALRRKRQADMRRPAALHFQPFGRAAASRATVRLDHNAGRNRTPCSSSTRAVSPWPPSTRRQRPATSPSKGSSSSMPTCRSSSTPSSPRAARCRPRSRRSPLRSSRPRAAD